MSDLEVFTTHRSSLIYLWPGLEHLGCFPRSERRHCLSVYWQETMELLSLDSNQIDVEHIEDLPPLPPRLIAWPTATVEADPPGVGEVPIDAGLFTLRNCSLT